MQEELRSAHEEMLSANEEFQSTNEELETSKEELQSTNEELTTTIDELRSRNQELARLNAELDTARRLSEAARAYADTIIQSVREPLAVLDGTLRVLRVNTAFAVNLDVPRDKVEGRFLHEVDDARWNIPDLHQKLRALLTSAEPLEDWQVTHRPSARSPGDVVERATDPRRRRPGRTGVARDPRRHGSCGHNRGAGGEQGAEGSVHRDAGP